eukprot:gene1996-1503_t
MIIKVHFREYNTREEKLKVPSLQNPKVKEDIRFKSLRIESPNFTLDNDITVHEDVYAKSKFEVKDVGSISEGIKNQTKVTQDPNMSNKINQSMNYSFSNTSIKEINDIYKLSPNLPSQIIPSK